jgi:hypothetical protein
LPPEKPGELGSNFGAREALLARNNAMEDSREALLDWISGLFVFEISIRRDAFLVNVICSFRSDRVDSESRFNQNDIIRDRQHPTAATWIHRLFTLLDFDFFQPKSKIHANFL